jgi:transketolase
VLPPAVGRRLGIEAASSFGWERWVGGAGAMVAVDRFGESAPYEALAEHFGFTVDNVARRARALLEDR